MGFFIGQASIARRCQPAALRVGFTMKPSRHAPSIVGGGTPAMLTPAMLPSERAMPAARDEACSSSCVSPSATSRGAQPSTRRAWCSESRTECRLFPAAVSVRDFAKPMWGTIQPRSAASTYAPQTSLGGAIHGHRPPLYHRPQPMEMGMPPELETLGNSDRPSDTARWS